MPKPPTFLWKCNDYEVPNTSVPPHFHLVELHVLQLYITLEWPVALLLAKKPCFTVEGHGYSHRVYPVATPPFPGPKSSTCGQHPYNVTEILLQKLILRKHTPMVTGVMYLRKLRIWRTAAKPAWDLSRNLASSCVIEQIGFYPCLWSPQTITQINYSWGCEI